MSADQGVLGRHATVLDAVAASPNGLILAEIMRATQLPRGTAHRLINSLLRIGYLEQRENRKIYVLGNRLIRLLHMRLAGETLADVSRPVLAPLAQRFKETAFLAKLDGDVVESAAMVMPERDRHSYVQPGRAMPLHAAASAKAIFAFQDEAFLARALQAKRVAFTPKTRTKRKDVLAELGRVRRDGFAVCLDELDPGVSSYACPVHVAGSVIYSVGLVGIAQNLQRFPVEMIVSALRDAADTLSDRLAGKARDGKVTA
ncbi:MAG: IclR family transcriptional regulator [Rhodoplanes sp.]